MHGDFTRFTFDRKKHYTGILEQQGRVTLDAGWNEYVEIQAYLNQTEAKDVIGLCGVPKTVVPDEVGKALEKELSRELNPKELEEVLTAKFGAGLFKAGKYVGGFMVGSKDGDLTIAPGRIYVDGILCELDKIDVTYTKQPDYPNQRRLKPADGRTDLVYLDVWQRHITAIEDPDIREVALGGPDTTTRVKTVWQVKVREGVGNVDCDEKIEGWPPPSSGGRLTTEAVPTPAAEDPCLIAPGGGYRGLENRLYRVEIHKGGALGAATFKWSRDNGAVVFVVEEFVVAAPGQNTTDKVKVKRLGRDQVLTLRKGNWVEVLDDDTELSNTPGTLAEITDIDEAERTLTLSKQVPVSERDRHPKVRRWDQGSKAITVTAGPISLEDGIQVRFSGSNFKTGDYWAFAARTATGDVEGLTNAPPRGIEHHYCRLALVTWSVDAAGNVTAKVRDCRKPFPPLTAITADDVSYRDTACKLGAKTVQETLDVLCKRQPGPAIGGLCTVTLGVNGVDDLQEAVDRLKQLSLESGWEGGCICIPAGEWRQQSQVMLNDRKRITIKGCGPASRIYYDGTDPLFVLEQSTDILFKDFAVFCEQATAFAVQGTDNAELTIEGCHINAPLGIVLKDGYELDGLFVRHNHLEASQWAVQTMGGGSLTNAQIEGNTMEGAGILFEVLSEGGDVVLARNHISAQQASVVEVGTMEDDTLLTLTENQIEADGMGVLVREMKSEARLILDENRLMTKGDEEAIVVQGAGNGGEVHINANVFRSPESMPVISIGGGINQDRGVAHVLFSNNQVYSSQAPDQQHCTVELNGRRLVVMGNYVADERGEWEEEVPPGTSICLPKRPEAVTAIGNVTRNGVAHEGMPVTDKLVVVNNAVF